MAHTERTEFFPSSTNFVHGVGQDFTNSSYLVVANYAHGISGIVCTPVVLTLLIVVVCVYKAYKTTLQRLVLYHIIISLLFELSYALRIELNFPSQRWMCVFVVYLYLFFKLSWYIYTTAVTNCLFMYTLRLIRGSPRMWRYGKVAECVCIFLALSAPMAYIWIPIQDGSYEAIDCDNQGSTKWSEDSTIWSIATVVLCVEVLFVYIALCGLICFIYRRLQSKRLNALLKRFLYHTGTNAVSLGISTLIAANSMYRYYNHTSKSLFSALYSIAGVGEPLVILVSAILQSLLSVQHRSNQHCTNCCGFCCKRRQDVELNVNESQDKTNPTSHPLNQPSHTYFSIPYTGQFTQVTTSEHSEDEGERTPLINNVDA